MIFIIQCTYIRQKLELTTIKIDVMHALENSGEKPEFGKEYEILVLSKGSGHTLICAPNNRLHPARPIY